MICASVAILLRHVADGRLVAYVSMLVIVVGFHLAVGAVPALGLGSPSVILCCLALAAIFAGTPLPHAFIPAAYVVVAFGAPMPEEEMAAATLSGMSPPFHSFCSQARFDRVRDCELRCHLKGPSCNQLLPSAGATSLRGFARAGASADIRGSRRRDGPRWGIPGDPMWLDIRIQRPTSRQGWPRRITEVRYSTCGQELDQPSSGGPSRRAVPSTVTNRCQRHGAHKFACYP